MKTLGDNAVNIAIEYFRALRSEIDGKIQFQWKMDSLKVTIFMVVLGVIKASTITSRNNSTNEPALYFWFAIVFFCLILDLAIYYRLREIEPIAYFLREVLEKKVFKPSLKDKYSDVTLWEELMEESRFDEKHYNLKMVWNISTFFSAALNIAITFICFESIVEKIDTPILWNYYIGHCALIIGLIALTCFPLWLFMWLRSKHILGNQ